MPIMLPRILPNSRKSLPIFQKIYVFMAKTRNPICLSLATRLKMKLRRWKDFDRKLLVIKHYDYGFLQEYQFSFSNNPRRRPPPPLFRHYQFMKGPKSKNTKKMIWGRDVYSVLFKFSSCLRSGGGGGGGGGGDQVIDVLVTAGDGGGDGAVAGEKLLEPSDEDDGDGESVDQRAERFIEKFYQEMRSQRQESASSPLIELFPIGGCY